MNFTELQFWPKLLAGLMIIHAIRLLLPKSPDVRSSYDRLALGILSLYLLSCVGHLTASIFLSVFLVAWCLVILMFKLPEHRRGMILWAGIPILCAPLIYYKYRIFLIHEVLGLDQFEFSRIAIPAGISFYTFQKIAMLVDASRMKSWKPKFLDYLNFASFFPQVVAGPIERRASLFPQIEKFSFEFSWARLDNGAPWIAIGFFYKICLADNLSAFIDKDSMDSAWPIVVCTFLFGLKIYFDFCGYSLIALGLAKCLGIDLTLNFKSPYWSGSIREFWRNWHISLSYWFRDYVYIPLGGGKTNRWWLNLLVVFVLSGIWHGAGWGFLIWGALHGVFSIISHFFKDKLTMPWWLGWTLTITCVFLSWLPFYETRTSVLWEKTMILASPSSWTLGSLAIFLRTFDPGYLLTLSVAVFLCLSAILLEGLCRLRQKSDYSHAKNRAAIAFFILCFIILGSTEGNEFIYFSF